MRFLRILLGILATLFVMAVVTLFLMAPNWVSSIVDSLLPQPGVSVVPRYIATVLIDFILFYMGIYFPLVLTNRGGGEHGLVVQRGQGRAYIDPESVRQQIYTAVTKVPDIQHADVAVGNQRGGAAITVSVLTNNNINAPRKKQELRREIRKVVEDQLGVRLAGEPAITMSLTPTATSDAVAPAKIAHPEPLSSRPAAVVPPPPAPLPSPEPKRDVPGSSPLFRRNEPEVKPASPASDDEDEAEPINPTGGPASESKSDLPANMPE